MSGMFEHWMHKLVSALMQRESEANVVIVDWISRAQQLYPDAVNHTYGVGLDIAALLNWLQVCTVIYRSSHPPRVPKLNIQILVMLQWVSIQPFFF